MKNKIEMQGEIPNIKELEVYLDWMRYGFVYSHNKLKEAVGWRKCAEVEIYAYQNGYTFRERNGKLSLNPWKKLS